ncbi:virulence factor SrfC family protein [Winslowiella toletana]|nr:virulence factor SrfC family protein [Winslowiella toletana]
MRAMTPKQLVSQQGKQLLAINEGIDMALTWLESSRNSALRLDMEADGVKIKLRRCRNQARHLNATAASASTLAFYGLSQPGKAWLLTSMVADASQRLETVMAGKTLDYFTHINPGNQDCGIVTRFSRQAEIKNKSWPFELTLFNEADMTCMVLSAALQQAQPGFDEAQLLQQLSNLQRHRQPEAADGITSDQMVAIWDFMQRHDAPRQKLLASHFWPVACELAPWLTIDDRARLFSLLWGGDAALTSLWRQLAHTLQNLSGASKVLGPLTLLIDEAQLPADALFNPGAITSLNMADDRYVQVSPRIGGRAGKAVDISLAELALLTVELLLPLHSTPREALFEQTDVLDIPGNGEPLDESQRLEAQRAQQQNPLAARLLRAKRGYLLEYYSDRQAINLLMVCSAAGSRDEVKAVSKSLDYWVKQTQGESAEVRNGRKPGLIWAITPHDQRHFQQQNHDEAVQRRIGNPGDMWGSMLALDRGGIQRMAGWLENEVRREVKTARIGQQLHELQREVADNLLGSWHQVDSDAGQTQKKQQIAETLLKALQTRTGLHGELLERLQPSRDELRRLYLQQPQQISENPAQASNNSHFGIGIEIDLFSELPDAPLSEQQVSAQEDDDSQFARQVQRYWVNHLRNLPENASLLELLDISKATLQMLVEELIVASFRLNIGAALRKMLTESEASSASREGKTDRQVSRALTVLGDFVAWLGFLQQSSDKRPESRINRGQKIFAQPATPAVSFGHTQRLTRLSAAPANTTAFYIYDWLVGLNALIVQNSGYSAASELKPAQRQQLAEIVALIKAP